MKVKHKIEIDSSKEKVYKILSNGLDSPRWNLVIDKIDEFESAVESPYYFCKTAIGNLKIVEQELVKNKSITYQMEESSINSLGLILSKKEDEVQVEIWADFDNPKNEALFKKTAELILIGLRSYVNFLEDGGNPEDYDKSSVLVSAL